MAMRLATWFLALAAFGGLVTASSWAVSDAAHPSGAPSYSYDPSAPSTTPADNAHTDAGRARRSTSNASRSSSSISRVRATKAGEKTLGPRFTPGKWLPHFEKHGAEFGYKNSMEYVKGARDLVGREGVEAFTRTNGDRLFYDAAKNEFAAMRPDGVLRTYFRPKTGAAYWKGQTGG